MDPAKDNKIVDFPISATGNTARDKWLLSCLEETIGVQQDRVNLLERQIEVLERSPAGGFFTPDISSVPGKWSCISWRDSKGIDHRVEDASFPKCLAKHLKSQPQKVLAVAAVIAMGLSGSYFAGQAYQCAETNGTIDAVGKSVQSGVYQVLENVLDVRDKFF